MDLGLALAIMLIALLGIPHGALDPMVAKRAGLMNSSMAGMGFYTLYTLIAAVFVGLWLWLPLPSLLVFLLVSAQHFGRDWHGVLRLGGFAYGAVVLGLPAWFQTEAVHAIFEFLLFGDEAAVAVWALKGLGVIGLSLALIDIRRITVQRLAELGALTLCAWLLDPIWYFVVYFCGLHSPRHLISEYRKMSKDQKSQSVAIMALITAITLVLAIGSGAWLREHSVSLDALIYQITFIGLFALTVPHMALMEWSRNRHGSE